MLKNTIIFICILTLFFSVSSREIFASEILFEDDFSDGFEKWQFVRDQGQHWTVNEGMANAYVNSKFSITEAVPKDQFWSDSWTNLEYSLDILPLAGVDRNVSFSFKNLSTWCEIHFVGNSYYLAQITDGNLVEYFSGAASLPSNHISHVLIRKNQDTISIFIDDNLVGEHKSELFNEAVGKIGIKAGTGAVSPTNVRFDNILVRSLDEPQGLDVPDIKQTDPTWADDQYDTAANWSQNPTINRWGCALTSLSMIFNFHKIDKMPDGTSTTPDHLNTWLKSQPDGYIGQGLLNWVAITRLARILNEQYQTTKLEYSKSILDHFQSAKDEIDQSRPVILQIPGHFVVAKGVSDDQSDLLINDPATSSSTLDPQATQLLSTRIFQPSQTDLSYLVFVFDPKLTIAITDQNSQPIANLDQFNDAIITQDLSESLPLQNIIHIPKPADGQYLINVSQEQQGPFTLQIFSYDDLANPTLLHQNGIVGPNGKTFELDYPTNQIKLISSDCSFEQFRQILLEEYQQKNIKKYYVFALIDKIATYAANADESKAVRYSNYLRTLITKYRYAMTNQVFDDLNDLLCY